MNDDLLARVVAAEARIAELEAELDEARLTMGICSDVSSTIGEHLQRMSDGMLGMSAKLGGVTSDGRPPAEEPS